ncbi:hypothetical protein CPB86DRAFT_784090 [Serendipita vermifera]|nr:hypothetical protein CPB86DRAFT_784090 [Serendipita vermifera]
MALGTGNRSGDYDSQVLVISATVAISIVFVLVLALAVMRARYMAARNLAERQMQEQLDQQLTIIFLHKPTMHEVWLSRSSELSRTLGEARKGTDGSSDWEQFMPLFASNEQSARPQDRSGDFTCSVGVLVQLPHPRRTHPDEVVEAQGGVSSTTQQATSQDRSLTSPEIVFGLTNPSIMTRPP